MPAASGTLASFGETLQRPFVRAWRRLSASQRSVPDFIIIGAQKCGTTSLFHYLAQHPQLAPSWRKEVHYFDGGLQESRDNYARGPGWYRSNFPLRARLDADQRVFEASPFYIFHPLAAQRIAKMLPDTRLVLMLRNPSERAISHYFHQQRKGRETLPIAQALAREDERLALAGTHWNHPNFRHYSYKRRGHYAEQINRYLDHFPREHLLVINSERFFAEPQASLAQVYDFVGVDTDFTVDNLQPRNVSGNRTDVDPAIYQSLDAYFEPHNAELYRLLGEDFRW